MTETTKKNVIRVQDVMFRRFEVMDGFSTVADAIRRMRDTRSKALFVARRDPDDEWGILLLSDIAKKVLAKDRSPERVNVYEIMTKPVMGVPPEMDIRYCVRLFEQFGISFAPVMQGREIIGTVRYADMVLNGMCQET